MNRSSFMNRFSQARRFAPVHLRSIVVAVASALIVSTAAWGQSVPVDALDYVAPEVGEQERAVDREARDLSFENQLDGNVTFEPAVTYSDLLDDEEDGSWSTEADLEAVVGYTWDRGRLLADRYQLAAARSRVETASRRGVQAALNAHALLLRHEMTVLQRERRVVAAEERAARVSEEAEAGEASPRQVEEQRLALERERRVLERDRLRLNELRDELAGYGMDPEVRYEPIRFMLPEPSAEDTFEYDRLRYLADRAQDQLSQRAAFGIVRDAYVTGTYAAGDIRLSGDAGLQGGRPRIDVESEYPGGRDRWSVGVRATFELNANLRDVPELQEDVDVTEEDLRSFVDTFPGDAAAARADALYAEEGVDLDEQGVALAEAELSEATIAFEEARSALVSAGEGAGEDTDEDADADRAELDAALQRAATQVERAEAGLLAARSGLYNSWRAYIGSVGRYLQLVEGAWEVRR